MGLTGCFAFDQLVFALMFDLDVVRLAGAIAGGLDAIMAVLDDSEREGIEFDHGSQIDRQPAAIQCTDYRPFTSTPTVGRRGR
jgi:hypothetical protein